MPLCSDHLERELMGTLAISCVLSPQNPRVAIFRVSSALLADLIVSRETREVRGHLSQKGVVLSHYPQEENDPREVGQVQCKSSAIEKGPLPGLLGDHLFPWLRKVWRVFVSGGGW